jgi:glyoxylase-like metal-dependent hydrolase (beta-lactamase superfamily II)
VRVLRPAPNVLAFYEGRDDGIRFSADGDNWVDQGALSLGIASYAVIDGERALVYDTHVSVDRGELIREALEAEGISEITVLLSHWHLDHVAGTEAFAGCEVLAGARTAELLREHRDAIEAGTYEGPPAIDPLVLPTRVLDREAELTIGATALELLPVNIHSDDATVVWVPEQRLLLAADVVEDTVTYVGEPWGFERHLHDLDRLDALAPARILPAHGDPDVIAAGGYNRGLLRATQQYIRALMRMREQPELAEVPLRELIAGPLETGWINYEPGYEAVHAENVKTVLEWDGERAEPA